MPGQVQVKKGISTDATNKTIARQNIPQTSKLFFLIGILSLKNKSLNSARVLSLTWAWSLSLSYVCDLRIHRSNINIKYDSKPNAHVMSSLFVWHII